MQMQHNLSPHEWTKTEAITTNYCSSLGGIVTE